MRKLQENFACYADKVGDPEVFASFTSILGKAKKFTKPEVKVSRIIQGSSKGVGHGCTSQISLGKYIW